jgi:hypothetical protein
LLDQISASALTRLSEEITHAPTCWNAVSDRPPDDSIARVFAGERVIARFAVAMGMATNDIERALRDVMLAREHDTPDLTYRVRLVIGHLVEALDSLNAYSCEFEDVRTLMRQPQDRPRHDAERRARRAKARPRHHVPLPIPEEELLPDL